MTTGKFLIVTHPDIKPGLQFIENQLVALGLDVSRYVLNMTLELM